VFASSSSFASPASFTLVVPPAASSVWGAQITISLQIEKFAQATEFMHPTPSAAAVIERDLDALACHLRFPSEHRKRIRSTNLLERTFVEVRRRTKVIGRFPGETSALCLIWAVLELSSRGWRGVVMTPRAVAEIERLRRSPAPDDKRTHPTEEVIAA
jgi:putative transposase